MDQEPGIKCEGTENLKKQSNLGIFNYKICSFSQLLGTINTEDIGEEDDEKWEKKIEEWEKGITKLSSIMNEFIKLLNKTNDQYGYIRTEAEETKQKIRIIKEYF